MLGDIHGCRDEFLMLLKKAHFKQGEDVLILTGDLVDKGPYSIQVKALTGFIPSESVEARSRQELVNFNLPAGKLGHVLCPGCPGCRRVSIE